MAREVTLYIDNSKQSYLAHKYLLKNKVIFEEVNVTKEGKRRIMIKASRIPFLIVKCSHGINAISGFDEFRYASALNPRLSHDEWVRTKNEGQNKLLD